MYQTIRLLETMEHINHATESFVGPHDLEGMEHTDEASNSVLPSTEADEDVAVDIQDTSNDETYSSGPTSSTPSPIESLKDIIESYRFPPGQKAMFRAIDDLRPELSIDDAIEGLRTAHGILHATLQTALQNPSPIQARHDIRARLQAEYDSMPASYMLDDLIKEGLLTEIKELLGQRWRVEALAAQGFEDVLPPPFAPGR